MKQYNEEQIKATLNVVEWSITACERVRPKLKKGSAQFSLNTNRLNALYLAKALIEKAEHTFSREELEKATMQITSLKSKSITGIKNAKEGTGTYVRFNKIISAMDIVLDFLEGERG